MRERGKYDLLFLSRYVGKVGGQKRICEEMSPPLLAAETDNMPPTIIISEDKDELRIRPSFIQSREECSI